MQKIARKTFKATGMGCAGCAARINTVLSEQPGVKHASVSFVSGKAIVEFDDTQCNTESLVNAVKDAGYGLSPDDEEENDDKDDHERKESKLQIINQIASASLSLAILSAELYNSEYSGVLMWILSTPAVFWCGRNFYSNAWKQLKHRFCSMDTLIALSTGISYFFSLFNLAFPAFWTSKGIEPHLYFSAASMVITFVLIGKMLENRAKRQTTSAIRQLMELRPRTVTVLVGNTEKSANIADIISGDTLVAHPGEKIAVDGTVTDGDTYIDESMLTGESTPIRKCNGAKVYAGTINQNGNIRYRADEVGDKTVLSQIIRMTQQAQDSKAPIQSAVDKVASIFVPAIIVIAVISLIAWLVLDPVNGLSHGILAAVTVLAISCPCALGLATPTAISVGMGLGAKNGILIKDAECLEIAASVSAVIMDKTGTLTEGQTKVTQAHFASDKLKGDILAKFKALESLSEHPLAKAVVAYADENIFGETSSKQANSNLSYNNNETASNELVTSAEDASESCRSETPDSCTLRSVEPTGITDFNTEAGFGVRGNWTEADGKVITLRAGSAKYIEMNGIDFPERLACIAKDMAGTTVWFAVGKSAVAVFSISDKLRDSALDGIRELKKMGITTHILSGDSRAATETIAKELGINEFHAESLPADKVEYIKQLQRAGYSTAMIGDGINDSAALAQSDVGIAMGKGSDIAISSAGITLINNDLRKVSSAIKLSRMTVKTLKGNLFWAFIYNVISIPVAAGILYPICGFLLNPMLASAAMALSSISVVTNSLLLKRRCKL